MSGNAFLSLSSIVDTIRYVRSFARTVWSFARLGGAWGCAACQPGPLLACAAGWHNLLAAALYRPPHCIVYHTHRY